MHRWILGVILLPIWGSLCHAEDLPKLAILTDIGGDPDDQQSLVRWMIYANQFDLQVMVASSAGTLGELKTPTTRPDLIHQVIDAYAKVRPKLIMHEQGWPSAEELHAKVASGNVQRGLSAIGDGNDTPGSNALIAAIDRCDRASPLNVAIWGGQTDLAQALWRIRTDRGQAGLENAIARLRIYDINDQDQIADWMRKEFDGMFYILAKAPPGKDKRLGTYRGMYLTGDESLTSLEWIDANIRSTGPLGALYPIKTWTAPNPHSCMKEGDTPSWFFFLKRGGNNPSDPTQAGWGGQYKKAPSGWYRDLETTDRFDARSTVSRWREEFQKDFAKRMAWCR